MRIIGLTGGIACGKSTVSSILRVLGAYIIDTDKIAYNIVQHGKPAWLAIVKHFGSQILNSDNSINRVALGDIVFYNSQERKMLEQIMHPLIKEVAEAEIGYARGLSCQATVLDVPLLFEVNWVDMVDEIWVVFAQESEQVNRLITRDNITVRQAMNRIKSQMNLSDKIAMADVIINNSCSIVDTEKQVITEWNRRLNSALAE